VPVKIPEKTVRASCNKVITRIFRRASGQFSDRTRTFHIVSLCPFLVFFRYVKSPCTSERLTPNSAYFDLLISCTACCTINPQQIEGSGVRTHSNNGRNFTQIRDQNRSRTWCVLMHSRGGHRGRNLRPCTPFTPTSTLPTCWAKWLFYSTVYAFPCDQGTRVNFLQAVYCLQSTYVSTVNNIAATPKTTSECRGQFTYFLICS